MDLKRWEQEALAVVRIVSGLLFGEHGLQKLIGWPPGGHGILSPLSFNGFGGVLEAVGGLLLVLGLFTRPTAFVLSGEMAVAYFIAHAPANFFPVNNHGDDAILFCFVFLFLVFAGPGAWSLDAMLFRKHAQS